ncbi:MAG TPA: TIGR03619 family F420-dependent LLM class oxidoreductase [Solirubrobacteraceae bacterium]|nr:TIGR03619 family F420-dependent LLM class oxidoreductase [Solirubrobacteraceae bacterium]
MEFGIGYFPTYDAIGPGPVARLVEDHGQDSLFFAEHTHIPAAEATPFPDGGPTPEKYKSTYDLFVALTAAAAATSRLRVGSGVCLVIERDPIITAKEVASVDHLAGGRLEFGVGAGWNREEMAHHGTDPRTRMRRMHETVEAMKAIWTEAEASYEGQFVSFDRIWCWPKPQQRPYPPVLVGGDGPTVFERVLGFGDGWFPEYTPEALARIPELRQRADRPLLIDMMGVPAEPRHIQACVDAGVRRALHWLPSAGPGVVEPALERWERAIAEVSGEA